MPSINELNEQEFLEKTKQYKGIIIRITRLYCNNAEDLKDLRQEIMYQLWKSFPSFRGASSFSTWMYRIAVNTCLLNIKKNKRSRIIERVNIFPEIVDNSQYTLENKEKSNIFYSAIQKLTPAEKAIIFYHLEELSHREIAEQLGISEVNARVKLKRIKDKLKNIIKIEGYEF